MSFDVREYEYHRFTRFGMRISKEPVTIEQRYSLVVNGERMTDINASPSDLEALGYGTLISLSMISSSTEVRSMHVDGNEIRVELFGPPSDGKGNSEDAMDPLTISPEYVFRSLEHLETETYRRTSGAHSATILDDECRIVARGVDASRHSAHDKAIGKALMMDADLDRSVLLASGRQSAEMVAKVVRAGIPIIISKAAPISSGIDLARGNGLTLICFADGEKFSVFSGVERIFTLP